jgi:N-acetylmuramoyl-L-alanine amidase
MSKSSLVQVVVPADEGNYTKGRSGRTIEAITIHHMAGRLTAEACGRIFQAKGRYGSSHYGVGYDGSIANYVDEEDTAWTNSNWDSNCKSITIEISDNDNSWYVNDTTLNAVIKLVADIAKRRGLGTLVPGKNLTWHSMFTSTTCPGDYLRSKMQYIADEANKINSEEPIKEKTTEELAREVIEGKYGNGEDRKNALGDRYAEVQARVNEILAPATDSTVDILDLVRKTIRGDFGNGEDRKSALGSNYDEVQRQVNLNIQNGTTNWDNVRLY